ncbi:MAG: DNA mismatch repair endonuclease MutL [Chloroflexota bacterium]
MSRRPIQVMPADLALKIAAGEVVERPASAVKELIDNAIDAGATRITIEVRDAGLTLIRVTDNGHGIPAEELELAFLSHATSKIASFDDLEQLATLGFRGEALPSIAAVARIDVQTGTAGTAVGARLHLNFGEKEPIEALSASHGLRIAISDLFTNVPARRRFVRSLRAEGSRIHNVVMQYALAQPAIQFSLLVDDRSVLEAPGTGSISDAFVAVYGAHPLSSMIPIAADETDLRISGLISMPGLTRPNRSAVQISVNGRPIQNRSLGFALEEAYSGFLMSGRHPVACIRLQVAPGDVDPNIHPAKIEVRFARDREVHGALHRAVAGALFDLRLNERGMGPAGGGNGLEPAGVQGFFPTNGSAAQPGEMQEIANQIPALRVFGQTNQAFIVAEGPRGLYMIDQHAAHERILFDRFDEQLSDGSIGVQSLLEPTPIDLEAEQMAALEENRELLREAGFWIEPFGDGTCLIRAIPALARNGAPGDLVREVLSELQHLPEPAAARERALAAMACKAAVKAGQVLSGDEMREIVTQLEGALRPNTCPHGRPTMIHLSHLQLEREFGRR